MINQNLADQIATRYAADMGKFKLHLFGGTMPTTKSALAAALSNRIVTFQRVTPDGGGSYGIPWAAVTAGTGYVGRDMSVQLQGTVAQTGVATWALISQDADALGAVGSGFRDIRSVGTSGAEVNLTRVSFTAGQTIPFPDDIQRDFNDI